MDFTQRNTQILHSLLNSFDTISFNTVRTLAGLSDSENVEDLLFQLLMTNKLKGFRIDGYFLVRSDMSPNDLQINLIDRIKSIHSKC